MAIEYKFECYWSEKDGWRFSFGDKRLWDVGGEGNRYAVATIRSATGKQDWEGDRYSDHQFFDNLHEALDYMRTGKRE